MANMDILKFEVIEVRRRVVTFDRLTDADAKTNIATYKEKLSNMYANGEFILEKEDIIRSEVLFLGKENVEVPAQ